MVVGRRRSFDVPLVLLCQRKGRGQILREGKDGTSDRGRRGRQPQPLWNRGVAVVVGELENPCGRLKGAGTAQRRRRCFRECAAGTIGFEVVVLLLVRGRPFLLGVLLFVLPPRVPRGNRTDGRGFRRMMTNQGSSLPPPPLIDGSSNHGQRRRNGSHPEVVLSKRCRGGVFAVVVVAGGCLPSRSGEQGFGGAGLGTKRGVDRHLFFGSIVLSWNVRYQGFGQIVF
mmetsp:Transcript_6115/g.12776  ORF Transcript_6115/g.12776 Transcript_6115/m.12776 type:complete len:227 (-) Transcript_6115:1177-1857(-)